LADGPRSRIFIRKFQAIFLGHLNDPNLQKPRSVMMRANKMPWLAFQRQSQIADDHWHSALVSLLRGLASIEVAAAHLRALMYPGLRTLNDPPVWFQGFAFFTGFQHQAVLVFFVISGWLVGGSLLDKIGQRDVLVVYAIDRVTRLWTVLIPTFVLTLLFALYVGTVSSNGISYSSANEYSAASFLGNLVGLQRIALPDFGGNFALWSLTNETWYYLLFPLLLLLFGARARTTRAVCLATVVLLAAWIPAGIMLYFSIWLLGVAFSRIRIDCGKLGRAGLLVLLTLVAVYFRLTGDNDNFTVDTFVPDLVFSVVFAIFLSSMQFKAATNSRWFRPMSRFGKCFADFSFSLYVMHVPLIFLLQHWSASFGLKQLSPSTPLHLVIYLGMLAFLVLASYVSYLLFESQTYRIRRRVKQLVMGGGERRPVPGKVPVKH
jgi:peptidoglycan/LPS O-acetylase OafA/YrhL